MRAMYVLSAALLGAGIAMGMTGPGLAAGYLKIGDIKGESIEPRRDRNKIEVELMSWSWGDPGATRDKDHKKWIDLESFGSAAHQAAQSGQGGPGSISVRMEIDKASPKLAEACANGSMIDEVDLTLPTGNAQEPYLKYKLVRAYVKSYSITAADGGDDRPTEEVAFYYNKVAFADSGAGDAVEPARATMKPMRAAPAR